MRLVSILLLCILFGYLTLVRAQSALGNSSQKTGNDSDPFVFLDDRQEDPVEFYAILIMAMILPIAFLRWIFGV